MTRMRVTAAVLAAGFLAGALTGRGRLLVRGWFLPALVVTAVLLALAAWKGRAKLSVNGAAVLLLPLVVAAGITPAVAGRVGGGAEADPRLSSRLGQGENPLLAAAGGPVTLLDVYLADQEAGAVYLAGRRVRVEAVVAEENRLSRMAMVCCAADARPVTLRVVGALPPPGTWVRVTGTLDADDGVTILRAERVAPIETPGDPFL